LSVASLSTPRKEESADFCFGSGTSSSPGSKKRSDDALIQPYSGHATRQSLKIYSRLSLAEAQPFYNQAMEHFPIQ
jgi:hypothetical protein